VINALLLFHRKHKGNKDRIDQGGYIMFSKLTAVVLGTCLLSGAAVGVHRFQSQDTLRAGKAIELICASHDDVKEIDGADDVPLQMPIGY
jgi:hypothetical protein